jgi:integrase/recombinase XerC
VSDTATAALEVPGGAHVDELAAFVLWLHPRQLASTTKAGYAERVDKYLRWLTAYAPQADPLTTPHGRDWAVRDYRAHMLTVAKHTPGTVATTLAAVAVFYNSVGLGGVVVERPELARRAPRALSPAEQRRLLREAEHCGSTRDRAIIEVLHSTGIRVGELSDLDVDDVPITARTGGVHVRAGKGRHGGKPRYVPLTAVGRPVVRAWLDERPSHAGASSPALWLSYRGTRLTTRAIRLIVERIATAAGVDANPHTLRHTAATRWLRNGVDLVTVAELLGHAFVDTTRIYTRPTAEEIAAAVERGAIDY